MNESSQISWPGWITGEQIGQGGFGSVYEIYRDAYGIQEKAALKVISIPQSEDEIDYLRSEGMDDESITTQFHGHVKEIVKEYEMMLTLKSCPNVVHCDDYMVIKHNEGLGWDIYLKMELLTPLLKATNQVDTEGQIIKLGLDLCNALITCQKKSILHRDIKPQNIFVDGDGNFKLGDFGIAKTVSKTTRATVGIGTYNFMAPEIMNGQPYGPTADIYSLGLVLYWLLNKHRGPFLPLPPETYTDAAGEDAKYKRFRGDPLPPPATGSRSLQQVILRACSFEPRRRYQNAQEMRRDLDAILANEFQYVGASSSDATIIPEGEEYDAVLINEDSENYDAQNTNVGEQPVDESPKRNYAKFLIAIVLFIMTGIGLYFIFGQIREKSEPPISAAATETASEATESSIKSAKRGEFPTENVLRSDALSGDPSPWEFRNFPAFGGNLKRSQIRSITFLDDTSYANDSAWDVSQDENGTVQAWTVKNGGLYDLYIGAEGGVRAPENCGMLFAGYGNVQEINFRDAFLVENVKNMSHMFAHCSKLYELDTRCLNTSGVLDMSNMFDFCYALTSLDVSGFDTSSVQDMHSMFESCNYLTSLDVSHFDTSRVQDMSYMFSHCQYLTSLDVSHFDTSCVQDMSWMFYDCSSLASLEVSHFNTSGVKNMVGMFSFCQNISTLDVSGFDTSCVQNMDSMFSSCNNLALLDVSHFNTSCVQNMSSMFSDCTYLAYLDVSSFNTSSVEHMGWMFKNCRSLTKLDVAAFVTSCVKNMDGMFSNCTSLISLDVSNFDTSSVEDMSGMFNNCSALTTLNVSGFDTTHVVYMGGMFNGCKNLMSLDVSNFDTSKASYMSNMFGGCSRLNGMDLRNFDLSSAEDVDKVDELFILG